MNSKNSKNSRTLKATKTTADLIAGRDPAGRGARLKTVAKIIANRKQELADVKKCEYLSQFAFTLDEQEFYQKALPRCQRDADNSLRTLRFLAATALDPEVRAAATAELL